MFGNVGGDVVFMNVCTVFCICGKMFQLLSDDHSLLMLQTKRKTVLYLQSKLKDNNIVNKLIMMQLWFRMFNEYFFLLWAIKMTQRSISRCLSCRVNKDGLKNKWMLPVSAKDIRLQLVQCLHHPISTKLPIKGQLSNKTSQGLISGNS